MESYEILKIEEDGAVAIVTINREAALNALNEQTIAELDEFFRRDILKRTHIRAVILTGAGSKAFVAGADIKGFVGKGPEEGYALSHAGQVVFNAIEQLHVPVIAAVNGFALGGGCELAMACHMRIAADTAKFGQPEVNLGLIPGYGATQRLSSLIGRGRAMEILLTGDIVDAANAYRIGLVNWLVPGEALIANCMAIAHKIASKAPLAISKMILCVNGFFDKDVDGYELEMEQFGASFATADFREGINAFVEKRKPSFTGE